MLFCGFVALRGLLFEEVDFVFKLLSFRPVQRADEHQPRGFSGQEFVFGFFAVPLLSIHGLRLPPCGFRFAGSAAWPTFLELFA